MGRPTAESQRAEVLRRLRSIEGHVHGISRMVDEETYCIDVIRQVQAVQAALDSVAHIILEDHLNSCVLAAVRGQDPVATERVLGEIVDVFRAGSTAKRRR